MRRSSPSIEDDRRVRARESLAPSEASFYSDDDDDVEDYEPLSQTDNPGPETQPDSTPARQRNDGAASAGPSGMVSSGGGGGSLRLKFVSKEKRLLDRCHGQITLEPLLVRVMDTREFQRLRTLKQLGGSVYVYPDASHSRFEHSIGVAHLSRRMVLHLQAKQAREGLLPGQEDAVDARDVTCVSLAGLVHDLGHGPFSHMFENFLNRPGVRPAGAKKFDHEDMSAAILEHLLARNGIRLEDYMGTSGPEAAEDLAFVQQLIHGLPPGEPMPAACGRPPSKRFLFEIVSNHRNGIDVDKIDYFLRDSSSAFGESSPLIQVTRLIESSAAMVSAEGEATVCFEEKMAMDLLGLFRTRMQLHAHLYQHHTCNVVEEMITDAFAAAPRGVPIVCGADRGGGESVGAGGGDGDEGRVAAAARRRGYDLVEAAEDVEAYVNLGDWVLEAIEASFDPRFAAAQVCSRCAGGRGGTAAPTFAAANVGAAVASLVDACGVAAFHVCFWIRSNHTRCFLFLPSPLLITAGHHSSDPRPAAVRPSGNAPYAVRPQLQEGTDRRPHTRRVPQGSRGGICERRGFGRRRRHRWAPAVAVVPPRERPRPTLAGLGVVVVGGAGGRQALPRDPGRCAGAPSLRQLRQGPGDGAAGLPPRPRALLQPQTARRAPLYHPRGAHRGPQPPQELVRVLLLGLRPRPGPAAPRGRGLGPPPAAPHRAGQGQGLVRVPEQPRGQAGRGLSPRRPGLGPVLPHVGAPFQRRIPGLGR